MLPDNLPESSDGGSCFDLQQTKFVLTSLVLDESVTCTCHRSCRTTRDCHATECRRRVAERDCVDYFGGMLNRVHIVGGKNSGKTTLVVELVARLTEQGYRVGTIKHTHHEHELDTPGKDSHRHRLAGAATVGILSPLLNAVYVVPQQEHDSPERYEELAALFDDCDLVLVEGHLRALAPKLEVWRAVNDRAPLALNEPSIQLIVTDDQLDLTQRYGCSTRVLPRSDLGVLAAEVLRLGG
jgi:molybdopterin-guanine dinucleotide biosynthesis protein B